MDADMHIYAYIYFYNKYTDIQRMHVDNINFIYICIQLCNKSKMCVMYKQLIINTIYIPFAREGITLCCSPACKIVTFALVTSPILYIRKNVHIHV